MEKLDKSEYHGAARYITDSAHGGIYPLSIAEMIQPGDIYTDAGSVLFWHYCGFAHIYGECSEASLDRVYEQFLSENAVTSRRFILFTPDERITRHFSGNPGILTEKRLFFEYSAPQNARLSALPDGYEICEISKENICKINGRITPYFSWDSSDKFLEQGKGYCVIKDGSPAAWAFSAAISGEEIDIGVETLPEYRGHGLASASATAMINYIIAIGKRPVWACHSGNEASKRLALKLGFVQATQCSTIKRVK